MRLRRRAAAGRVDARPRAPGRRRAQLADHQEARRRAARGGAASTDVLPMLATLPSGCPRATGGCSRSSGTASARWPSCAAASAARGRDRHDLTLALRAGPQRWRAVRTPELRGRRRGVRARRAGRPSFSACTRAAAARSSASLRRARAGRRPLSTSRSSERRERLEALVRPQADRARLGRFDDGQALLPGRAEHGLEGVMAKARARSTSRAGAAASGSR